MADAQPPAAPVPDTRCADCGVFTELSFGGVWICAACYQTRGSCCHERVDDDGDADPR